MQAGNSDSLGTELLESLLKMAPTKEEERKLKEFKDESPFKLGPAEKFLKAVLDVPYAFKRVDAMLYIANFDSEVDYLKRSFETLEVNKHMLFIVPYVVAFKINTPWPIAQSLARSIFHISSWVLAIMSSLLHKWWW